MLEKLKDFFIRDEIGEPPWEYNFLVNLDEKEYPRYLARLFQLNTGENLPLKYDFKNQAWIIDKKKCKTFNQKIQWLKLYGVTDLMRQCTDKVAVRDYVKEKIGEEYLKPVLQIIPNDTDCRSALRNLRKSETRVVEGKVNDSDSEMNNLPERQQIPGEPSRQKLDVSEYFDQVDFDNLPNAFVMKCNHGCKWQYIIKDKEQYLNTPQLVEIVKKNMTGWLEQNYSFWGGFEMQYATSRRVVSHNSNSGVRTRLSEGIACDSDNEASDLPEREGCQEKGIKPKILIEPLMRDEINTQCQEIHVYCFSGMPKLIIKLHNENEITIWDENLKITEDPFKFKEIKINIKADDLVNQSYDLSKQLSMDFVFVRVDWMIFQNKLYFEEFTFTPYSGFNKISETFRKKLGERINLERI